MNADAGTRIERKPFGKSPGAELFTLTREGAPTVRITNQGGHIVAILAPDRTGAVADVSLGYSDFDGYVKSEGYIGGTIGRYANRIAKGAFTLDGKKYTLACNNAPNSPPRWPDRLRQAALGREGRERPRRGCARADLRQQGRRRRLPGDAHRQGRLLAARRRRAGHGLQRDDRRADDREPHEPRLLQPGRRGRAHDPRPRAADRGGRLHAGRRRR